MPFALRSEAFSRSLLSNHSSRRFVTLRPTMTPPYNRMSVSTSRTQRLHIERMICRPPPVGCPQEGHSVPLLAAWHFGLVDLPWEAPHGSGLRRFCLRLLDDAGEQTLNRWPVFHQDTACLERRCRHGPQGGRCEDLKSFVSPFNPLQWPLPFPWRVVPKLYSLYGFPCL